MKKVLCSFLMLLAVFSYPATSSTGDLGRVNEIVLQYAEQSLDKGEMSEVFLQTWICFRGARLMAMGADFKSRGATEKDLEAMLLDLDAKRNSLYGQGFDIGETMSPKIDAYFAKCLLETYEPYEK